MQRDALISPCGRYRYWLTRQWDMHKPEVCFIMLNPSDADASIDDPTIRRCVGFAKAFECGRLVVVNLFGFRSPSPTALRGNFDPIGETNDAHLMGAARSAKLVICAWGNHGKLHNRNNYVLNLLKKESITPHALKISLTGHPCHPLYLKGSLIPAPMF